MFFPLHQAIRDRIVGDTLSAALLAGTTASVLKVADATPWTPGMLLYVRGSGASASNNYWVSAVAAVSLSLNTLTIQPTLPATPVAGDLIKAGCREWMRYVDSSNTGLSYRKDPGQVISAPLVNDETDPRGVGHYTDVSPAMPECFELAEGLYEVRFLALTDSFAEGFITRAQAILHAQPDQLSAPGMIVSSCETPFGWSSSDRADALYEKVLTIDLRATAKEAA